MAAKLTPEEAVRRFPTLFACAKRVAETRREKDFSPTNFLRFIERYSAQHQALVERHLQHLSEAERAKLMEGFLA